MQGASAVPPQFAAMRRTLADHHPRCAVTGLPAPFYSLTELSSAAALPGGSNDLRSGFFCGGSQPGPPSLSAHRQPTPFDTFIIRACRVECQEFSRNHCCTLTGWPQYCIVDSWLPARVFRYNKLVQVILLRFSHLEFPWKRNSKPYAFLARSIKCWVSLC